MSIICYKSSSFCVFPFRVYQYRLLRGWAVVAVSPERT